jgi:hypothetical protein
MCTDLLIILSIISLTERKSFVNEEFDAGFVCSYRSLFEDESLEVFL